MKITGLAFFVGFVRSWSVSVGSFQTYSSRSVKTWPGRFRLVLVDQDWSLSVEAGPGLSTLVLVGQDWSWSVKAGPGRSKLVLVGLDWSWSIKTGPGRLRPVQSDPGRRGGVRIEIFVARNL